MISPLVGQVTLGIYAALLGVGGVIGFVKARSHVSLVSGLLAAGFAVVALGLSLTGSRWGIPLGALLAVVLFVLFGYRYSLRSHKFMPSGMIAVVSLVVVAIMMLSVTWGVG